MPFTHLLRAGHAIEYTKERHKQPRKNWIIRHPGIMIPFARHVQRCCAKSTRKNIAAATLPPCIAENPTWRACSSHRYPDEVRMSHHLVTQPAQPDGGNPHGILARNTGTIVIVQRANGLAKSNERIWIPSSLESSYKAIEMHQQCFVSTIDWFLKSTDSDRKQCLSK